MKGEDDKTVTAGSLVTVTVELHREPLIDFPVYLSCLPVNCSVYLLIVVFTC